MRPANLITAIADVAAGMAVGLILAGGENIWKGLQLAWADYFLLWIATVGLYGGGVVFNDIFDLSIDRVERPERPLPSGAVSLQQATTLGIGLLSVGVLAAFAVNVIAGGVAILTAFLALLYDKVGKHHPFWGPLNMSLCRGANLMLGVSAFPESLNSAAVLMILPVIYISSITLISRGEVGGGNKTHLTLAVIGYALVGAILLSLDYLFPYNTLNTLPFIIAFFALVYPPLFRARNSQEAGDIRKAVKAGVITLILLDAALAAGFTDIGYGLLIACLLPVSLRLGKFFAVT
ncbi:polyprenyltransferase [Flavilitoribacter nigricans DSM 23189 = NBRC 102662]|uniref:Polyprenyltransferase n=2 Tax=Flavilitoribacter TaxID=2762562 RepID=A0A2D0N1C3_FLAN2|nr:polyprenyltransferase [Flavilitoribacter nigricans DSM 23189 = NBRC 102662]